MRYLRFAVLRFVVLRFAVFFVAFFLVVFFAFFFAAMVVKFTRLVFRPTRTNFFTRECSSCIIARGIFFCAKKNLAVDNLHTSLHIAHVLLKNIFEKIYTISLLECSE